MEMNWIPVSERLPEKKGRYVVTTDSKYNDTVEVTFYDPKHNIWHIASNVIAWMPMPEPYRKDGENG